MTREEKFMLEAIAIGIEGMRQGNGGPFGCVIVKDNEIIGRGCNNVLLMSDPTAHAEIVAIRDACKNLADFQLQDCEVYASCEPCPMCMGAIYWARPRKVFYANTKADAAGIGFDDSFIYEEIALPCEQRKIPLTHVALEEAIKMFDEWKNTEHKKLY